MHLRDAAEVFKLAFPLLVGPVCAYFSCGAFDNASTVFYVMRIALALGLASVLALLGLA